MEFEPFEKEVLSERIAARILSMIKKKQLGPGDKLPPERELAAKMQVSRPSLQKALRGLAFLNVLEIRQGDGTYITSLDPGLLTEPLTFIFSLDDSMFTQLYEARKILEVGIAALAAQWITDEEIVELEDCLAGFNEAMEDDKVRNQADLELHAGIARAARNPILARFMDSISQLTQDTRRRTSNLPGVAQQSAKDHRAIVDALKAHDPEAARQAMLQHLQNVERAYNSSFHELSQPK